MATARMRAAGWLVAAALTSGCQHGGPESTLAWCTSVNPSARLITAPIATVPLSLTEVWRRAGMREGETLGYPTAPVVGPSGWIAIPDFQLGTVIVLDSTGGWMGSVTQRGQGPGETRLPVAGSWSSDGTLSVLDAANLSVIHLVPPDFHFRDQTSAPRTLLEKAFARGQILAVFLDAQDRVGVEPPREPLDTKGAVRDVFAVESSDGRIDTLVSDVTEIFHAPGLGEMITPGHLTPLAGPGPGGSVAVAGDIPQYRVRVLGTDLRDSLVICRDVPPEPLTASEHGDAPDSAHEALVAALKVIDHPSVLPAIGRVFMGTAGELWVQRDRLDPLAPQWPTAGATYDVYRPNGSYEGTLTAPPGAFLYGQIGSLVIGYERGQYDEISVVAYRLIPNA